jgi:Protein tyrosine and serine/threonine kinase
MSPEQCRAEPLDRRSDVFSLGIVLWELCAGERLYGAAGEGDFEVFKQIVERDAPLLRSRRASCPVALETIVSRALQRDRARRYQTAAELQDDLEALVRSSALSISPREVGAFVSRLFPARSDAWRRGERVTKTASRPDVRATVELRSAEPAEVAPAPPEPRRRTRRWLVAGAIAIGLAVALGFIVGRRTTTPTPVVMPAGVDDAHWLQADDYLISETPYRDGRLDGLRVAKLLGEIDHASNIGRFLDGNARERATATHWKSHVAKPGELTIGARAACRADSWMLASAGPQDRAESRTQNWMLARVTDIAERAAGRVTVGDVVCQVTGVRIVE